MVDGVDGWCERKERNHALTFEQTVDDRILGREVAQAAMREEVGAEGIFEVLSANVEHLAQFVQISRLWLGLAVEAVVASASEACVGESALASLPRS